MFLDGAADDKDGSPASWTFVDPDGMQVTIFLERTDARRGVGQPHPVTHAREEARRRIVGPLPCGIASGVQIGLDQRGDRVDRLLVVRLDDDLGARLGP